MGLEADFTGILRDFVQFLEAISDVYLPPTLENLRENLLSRSKSTLLNLAIGPPSTPEPYLDMSVGKSFLLAAKSQNEIQEYVNTDLDLDPKRLSNSNPDYYETFQEINDPKTEISLPIQKENEDSMQNTLATIYSNFSAAHTRINCNKCGHLSRKSEKKMFPFIDPLRPCWVGLVGSHLLIYGNEKDCRPNTVIPIRGYRGRPAPSIDSKRSESAFEIFCPGHKTLQFVAKTPEDMEEWVAMICETSTRENDNKTRLRESSFTETLEMEQKETKNSQSSLKEEAHQDATVKPSKSRENLLNHQLSSIPDLNKDANSEIFLREKSAKQELHGDDTPPLPARIPRRLPSLPHEEAIPSFEIPDEPYDEDDIYHKIEDFRDGTRYQNIMVAKKEEEKKKEAEARKNCFIETYDDVAGEIRTQQIEENLKSAEFLEAYDDVRPVAREPFSNETELNKEQTVVDSADSYDDVQTIASDLSVQIVQEPKEQKLSGAARIKASKKSFLDRMRNRSYILKKESKNRKRGSSSESSTSSETAPTYDDISGIVMNPVQQTKPETEEQSEYLCPPAPRPIYSIPPPITTCLEEQLYDDIASFQDKNTKETENFENDNSMNTTSSNRKTTEVEVSAMKLDIIPEKCFHSELGNTSEKSQMDFEYYQTPRSDRVLQDEEVLYDDVALLSKFRAKPRESSVSNFEKVWNRFSSGRSKNSVNETEENTNSLASNDHTEVRTNRFQKLVNKIENTLGKSPVKPMSLSNNSKSHSSNSVT